MPEKKEFKVLQKEAVERAAKFFKEYDGDSDRAAAILIAADFENALKAEIEDEFVTLDTEIKNEIFTNSGALSTFAAKINIGYALGLFGPETRKSLKVAKNIRNKFAHAAEPLTFADAKISKLCKDNFEPILNNNPEDSRERYSRYLAEVIDNIKHAGAARPNRKIRNPPALP